MSPHLFSQPESGQGVFRGISRGAPVCNDSEFLRYAIGSIPISHERLRRSRWSAATLFFIASESTDNYLPDTHHKLQIIIEVSKIYFASEFHILPWSNRAPEFLNMRILKIGPEG